MDCLDMALEVVQMLKLLVSALGMLTPNRFTTLLSTLRSTRWWSSRWSFITVGRQYGKIRSSRDSRLSPIQSGHCVDSMRRGKRSGLGSSSVSTSGDSRLIGSSARALSRMRSRLIVSLLSHRSWDADGPESLSSCPLVVLPHSRQQLGTNTKNIYSIIHLSQAFQVFGLIC